MYNPQSGYGPQALHLAHPPLVQHQQHQAPVPLGTCIIRSGSPVAALQAALTPLAQAAGVRLVLSSSVDADALLTIPQRCTLAIVLSPSMVALQSPATVKDLLDRMTRVAAAHTDVYFLLPVAALTMPGVDSDLLSTVHNLTEGRSIQRSQNARIRVGWLSPGQDPAATLMTLVQLHAASLPFTPCAPSAGQQGGSGGGQTQEAAQEAMAQWAAEIGSWDSTCAALAAVHLHAVRGQGVGAAAGVTRRVGPAARLACLTPEQMCDLSVLGGLASIAGASAEEVQEVCMCTRHQALALEGFWAAPLV